jgi:Concanavalin A-like lectin/glucanases superfamily
MPNPKMIFGLKTDSSGFSDGSLNGISIAKSKNTKLSDDLRSLQFNKGFIELSRNPAIDKLQAFSLSATITPNRVDDARQNIMESQQPGIAFFTEGKGKLTGSVNVNGWQALSSASGLIKAGQPNQVRFTRNTAGKMELFVNDKLVASKTVQGAIAPVGERGMIIGSWVDGNAYAFEGRIADVGIFSDALDSEHEDLMKNRNNTLITLLKTTLKELNFNVSVKPGQSVSRLAQAKDLLRAAGVESLSDLETLRITKPIVITRNKMLIAARKTAQPSLTMDYPKLVRQLKQTSDLDEKSKLLATYLPNRNSTRVLKNLGKKEGAAPPNPQVPTGRDGTGFPGFTIPTNILVNSKFTTPTAFNFNYLRLGDLFKVEEGQMRVIDPGNFIPHLEKKTPFLWPNLAGIPVYTLQAPSLPVDSAVIIAQTLDLTNTTLVVEPDVTTLYIIAERVICGNGAKITWRRPGGTTPGRLADPDLNGMNASDTYPDSRDGRDGEDGRYGASGISGARGRNAPHLEMWVKDMSALPDLDINGENGIRGGTGQTGGRGGRGANGEPGKWAWFFGEHCVSDAGNGGDGGNGGNGGSGGRGGNGGNGGNITIGVLFNTLDSTVKARAFKLKNQGGTPGQGGAGGTGGAGGSGGRSGNGQVCQNGRDGSRGAQGSLGTPGSNGSSSGNDGTIQFFEFSEEEWNEQLTRPWLVDVQPSQMFPGDTINIKGSRLDNDDKIFFDNTIMAKIFNPDGSATATIPNNASGGQHTIYFQRPNGMESNRLQIHVRPRLDALAANTNLLPGTIVSLRGSAFLNGASVLVDGAAVPGTVTSANNLSFQMPGTGGAGQVATTLNLQVRNPDGLTSNVRQASIPDILEIPFRWGVHNLPFDNFSDGVPSWSTYEQTFGAAEVWHELLDPVFGHPVLTGLFYALYHYYLKGKKNDGLATGFCTSLTALVADKLWRGDTNTFTTTKASVHSYLTGVHGKLLSKQSLTHFHDQSREGLARIERTTRDIEACFLNGTDRHNAPMLFFIPAGAIWDDPSMYIDRLNKSHCVMPYRFVYPAGHKGPVLSADRSTTISDLHGVKLYVWDCNNSESSPSNQEARFEFERIGGILHFKYYNGIGSNPFFDSQVDGITLGHWTNGAYHLDDHDLPFGGPLGVTSFIIDFILSPADIEVTDSQGRRTGFVNGKIQAEIPESYPAYLVPGVYLLPANQAYSRKIIAKGKGTYSFNSMTPDGTGILLENVPINPGQTDELAISADGTQIRFTPAASKKFNLTLSRLVNNEARAYAIEGIGGDPGDKGLDIAFSPDLSVLRLGNRGSNNVVSVKALNYKEINPKSISKALANVALPNNHDLVVSVANWDTAVIQAEVVPF